MCCCQRWLSTLAAQLLEHARLMCCTGTIEAHATSHAVRTRLHGSTDMLAPSVAVCILELAVVHTMLARRCIENGMYLAMIRLYMYTDVLADAAKLCSAVSAGCNRAMLQRRLLFHSLAARSTHLACMPSCCCMALAVIPLLFVAADAYVWLQTATARLHALYQPRYAVRPQP